MPELSTLPIEGEQLVDASVTYDKLEALAGAAPAAPGQVLTAVDADTAAWQSPPAASVAGAGLVSSGSTWNVAAADGSIQVNPDSINVRLDPAGALGVSAAGIKVLASDASITIAGTGVALGAAAAGNGLTKTGAALNVVAADPSIVVAADSIRVGTLTDALHGNRGGGSLHPIATVTTDGFMASEDRERMPALYQGASKGYRSRLPAVSDTDPSLGFGLQDNVIYWVYVGRTTVPVQVAHVALFCLAGGTGAQDCQMAVGTTPSAPDGASWLVTCTHAFTTVDMFNSLLGLKKSTSAASGTVAAGSFMWIGIRCTLAGSVPIVTRIFSDNHMGLLLRTSGVASSITGGGTVYVGTSGRDAGYYDGPDLSCLLV